MKLRSLSFQSKLILVGTATSLFTMVLGSAAFISYELHSRRKSVIRDYSTLAEVVADTSAASVIFEDDASARERLLTFRTRPSVTFAAILRPNGKLFAVYDAGGGGALSASRMLARETGYEFGDEHAYFAAPIQWDGETVGHVILEISLAETYAKLQDLGVTAAVILLLSVIVAIVISSLLHKVIARPLQQLAVLARQVEVHQDYSIRAVKDTDDEVGFLTDAFNDMLSKVEERDHELNNASVMQELEIDARTRQLRLEIAERKKIQRNLEDAKTAAEAGSQAKSDFLANMSHEIRTPMNGILGMSELLGRTPLTGEQIRHVRTIQTCSETLLFLINDILDFSKIEAGMMELESVAFDLREEVEEVAALVAPRAQEKAVELTCRIEVGIERFLVGDPGRLRQILTNLAVNAVKFTEKGFVLIDVSTMRLSAGKIRMRCSVQDSGIGISEDRHADIFEMFQQADGSTTRRFGGTGLGLTISRQLVEMMGGEIGLESAEGRGSTFWFTLELASQERPTEELWESDSVRGRRILVVDDNEVNRLVLTELVSFWGSQVGVCSDGMEAMAELERAHDNKQPYDVVLLDNKMPGLRGSAVCDRIREDSRLRDTRIILLSSLVDQEPAARQWDARLSKPVRQVELHRAVAKVLGMHVGDGSVSQDSPAVRGDGIRVLIVEDNPVNQELAVEVLRQSGFSTEVAGDGVEAVLAVQNSRFDVVLMDCQMPRMDGFDATAAIRGKRGEVSKIPIVALTAHAMKGDREKCLNAGMNDYLVKPLNPAELVSKIFAWTRGKQKEAPQRESVPAMARTDRPIDYQEALERCGSNQELLDRLLAKFSKQLQQEVPELGGLVEGGNWDEAASVVHKLKGAAANLSAMAVRESAANLMVAFRESDAEAVGEGIVLLKKAAAAFCEEVGLRQVPAVEQAGA